MLILDSRRNQNPCQSQIFKKLKTFWISYLGEEHSGIQWFNFLTLYWNGIKL